jgi:hypothetical protein
MLALLNFTKAYSTFTLIHVAGGCRKHNFWTACLFSVKNYIFEILTSRAINWYIYGSNQGGLGWGGPSVGF